jgi:RNA 3'-terminal phosphate cyclase-like protein
MFRQRVTTAALSGKVLVIDKIRAEDQEAPGLHDFEANFLKLVEKLCDGCQIDINETGTKLRFKPGILTGGRLQHNCGTSRSIGWYIEGILPLAIFCKEMVQMSLQGVTHDQTDISVDVLRAVTLPLLKNFGIEGVQLQVNARGAFPKGGGAVVLTVPIVRELTPVHIVDEGLVARVRGTAFGAKVSPTIVNRLIDSARGVLNNLLPDVYITSDHVKGQNSGNSAGYSLSLVSESSTGVLLSAEHTAGGPNAPQGEMPEDIGTTCAHLLLQEIKKGGVIDRTHQPLVLQLMVMGPEDVCKVRFGSELTPQAITTLQLLRDAFGTLFKVKRDSTHPDVGEGSTLLLSCLGTGYKNMSRKIV